MEIGVISEGYTDQIILEAIVQGHLSNRDQTINSLQPKKGQQGGWSHLLSYCSSSDFRESFNFLDVMIIQIDCDVLKGQEIPPELYMEFNGLSTSAVFEMVKNKIIEIIGHDFYLLVQDKIAFAIAIDELECWFLPLYFGNKPALRNKSTGCIDTLNRVLTEKEGFYIDGKDSGHYETIGKYFTKSKNIQICYGKNESFALFIDSLNSVLVPLTGGGILAVAE